MRCARGAFVRVPDAPDSCAPRIVPGPAPPALNAAPIERPSSFAVLRSRKVCPAPVSRMNDSARLSDAHRDVDVIVLDLDRNDEDRVGHRRLRDRRARGGGRRLRARSGEGQESDDEGEERNATHGTHGIGRLFDPPSLLRVAPFSQSAVR